MTKTKFALINVRSLRNKTLLVHDYTDDCSADIKIVALTETWLRDEDNASVSELCRDTFSFAHQPRGGARRGGGVGVLFRKSFQFVSRVSVDTCASETLSVTLRNARIDCTTRVIVMYRPPRSCFKTFQDDGSKVLLIVAAHPTETIVCGDFSTRYKDSTCTDAINLADLLDTSGFVQHVSGATHERGSILDLIVTAKTSNLLTTPVSPTTLLTDHCALECDLNVVKPEHPKRRVRYRKFASIDKRAFTADIRDAFAVMSGTTVESIDNYNTAIEAIVKKHAPVVTRVIADRPKTPWHTEELSCAKRVLRRAEPRWRKTRLIGHRQIYTTAYIRRIILQSSEKSCTLYPMPTSLLKENIDILVPVYTVIVNSSLESGVVPAAMKHAIVTPILKKSGIDLNCLTNYRPISNLSFLSKTLERYVASELRHYLDTNGFNDPFKSAYRPKHSPETALVRIHEYLRFSVFRLLTPNSLLG